MITITKAVQNLVAGSTTTTNEPHTETPLDRLASGSDAGSSTTTTTAAFQQSTTTTTNEPFTETPLDRLAPSTETSTPTTEATTLVGSGGEIDGSGEGNISTNIPPTTSAGTLSACLGDNSLFNAGYGRCDTYAFAPNHDHCNVDKDISTGVLATKKCAECGECTAPVTTFTTTRTTTVTTTVLTSCVGNRATYDTGFGNCASYGYMPNLQFCRRDKDKITGLAPYLTCQECRVCSALSTASILPTTLSQEKPIASTSPGLPSETASTAPTLPSTTQTDTSASTSPSTTSVLSGSGEEPTTPTNEVVGSGEGPSTPTVDVVGSGEEPTTPTSEVVGSGEGPSTPTVDVVETSEEPTLTTISVRTTAAAINTTARPTPGSSCPAGSLDYVSWITHCNRAFKEEVCACGKFSGSTAMRWLCVAAQPLPCKKSSSTSTATTTVAPVTMWSTRTTTTTTTTTKAGPTTAPLKPCKHAEPDYSAALARAFNDNGPPSCAAAHQAGACEKISPLFDVVARHCATTCRVCTPECKYNGDKMMELVMISGDRIPRTCLGLRDQGGCLPSSYNYVIAVEYCQKTCEICPDLVTSTSTSSTKACITQPDNSVALGAAFNGNGPPSCAEALTAGACDKISPFYDVVTRHCATSCDICDVKCSYGPDNVDGLSVFGGRVPATCGELQEQGGCLASSPNFRYSEIFCPTTCRVCQSTTVSTEATTMPIVTMPIVTVSRKIDFLEGETTTTTEMPQRTTTTTTTDDPETPADRIWPGGSGLEPGGSGGSGVPTQSTPQSTQDHAGQGSGSGSVPGGSGTVGPLPTTLPILETTTAGTTPTEPCVGNPNAFDGGYGACSSYLISPNNKFCWTDKDKTTGMDATKVCAQCGNCVAISTVSTSTTTTATITSGIGACVGNAAAFDAGHGNCVAYSTMPNNQYCAVDADTTTGLVAKAVCPQCDMCAGPVTVTTATPSTSEVSTEQTPVATTKQTPVATTKQTPVLPICISSSSAFDAGYGACSTYGFAPNSKHCASDKDKITGVLAASMCPACRKCVMPSSTITTKTTKTTSTVVLRACIRDRLAFSSGHGSCYSYGFMPNFQYCKSDLDQATNNSASKVCVECGACSAPTTTVLPSRKIDKLVVGGSTTTTTMEPDTHTPHNRVTVPSTREPDTHTPHNRVTLPEQRSSTTTTMVESTTTTTQEPKTATKPNLIAENTTIAVATTPTGFDHIDPQEKCFDYPMFRDSRGFSCVDWGELNCDGAASLGYSSYEQTQIQQHCRKSCDLCKAGEDRAVCRKADDNQFVDQAGRDCSWWAGRDCVNEASEYGLALRDSRELLQHCTYGCGLCQCPKGQDCTMKIAPTGTTSIDSCRPITCGAICGQTPGCGWSSELDSCTAGAETSPSEMESAGRCPPQAGTCTWFSMEKTQKPCTCSVSSCFSCKFDNFKETCLACGNGEFLLDGKCVRKCPSGLVSVGSSDATRTCRKPYTCHFDFVDGSPSSACSCSVDKCFTCNIDEEGSQCTRCQKGYYLYSNTCVRECPDSTNAIGTDLSPGGKLCWPRNYCADNTFRSDGTLCTCPKGCSECRGGICRKCKLGSYFLDGFCMDSCPESFEARTIPDGTSECFLNHIGPVTIMQM